MSDLISRRAVKEQACMFYGHKVIFANRIDLIPSADRPTGEWVKKNYVPYCSECGRSSAFEENYCPNCGAKMEGGEEK